MKTCQVKNCSKLTPQSRLCPAHYKRMSVHGTFNENVPIRKNHGLSKSREYRIWHGMLSRCTRANVLHYNRYGGRGIRVCERWKSFENFLADMGKRPSPSHSLDRIDNDGDYCPENCRWATKTEQSRNTSANRLITFAGDTKTLTEWAETLGLKASTLYARLVTLGWPLEKAFNKPKGRYKVKALIPFTK